MFSSSSSSSWSESTVRNSGVAVTTSFSSIWNGSVSTSVKIESWLFIMSFPALHGWVSLKQWIRSSSDPSVARFSAHDLKEVLIVSGVIFSQASRIHFSIVRRGGGFKFPPAVSLLIPSSASQSSYFSVSWALKGLFQLTSWAWIYFVQQPGTIDTSIFLECREDFTLSSMWHS